MTTELPLPELFPKDDIPTIIQDVLNCCLNLQRPTKKEKRPEEALSKEVYRRLTRILRYRTGPLEPHIEDWLTDLESRADIKFGGGKGLETYFIIEAKRLFVTFSKGKKAPLIDKYIDQGMMRFIEGRYAPYQQASAMLGYVHDEDISTARKAVGNAITASEGKVCLKKKFQQSCLKTMPLVDETGHDIQKRPFTLFHLFVKV